MERTSSVFVVDRGHADGVAVTLQVNGDTVGVSAVDETNTLLVRSTPGSGDRSAK